MLAPRLCDIQGRHQIVPVLTHFSKKTSLVVRKDQRPQGDDEDEADDTHRQTQNARFKETEGLVACEGSYELCGGSLGGQGRGKTIQKKHHFKQKLISQLTLFFQKSIDQKVGAGANSCKHPTHDGGIAERDQEC